MEDVYVDIREENESIRSYFPDKDFVSVDALLNCIDDLDSQLDKMQEELDELREPEEEKYDKWKWNKVDEIYEEQRLRELEGLQ